MVSLISGEGVQFCPVDFSGGEYFMNRVLTLVADDVLLAGDEIRSLIERRYRQMSQNFHSTAYDNCLWELDGGANVVDKKKPDARLAVPRFSSYWNGVNTLFDYYNFGHDLPVWLVPDGVYDINSCPRVLILSEDPLRDDDDKGFVYLSTPFGIHSSSFRKQIWDRETGYPLKLAENIVKAGGVVWMTDFRKLFAYGKKRHEKGDDKKLLNPVRRNYTNNDMDYVGHFQYCLHREIDIFRPDIVVTLGREAVTGFKETYSWLHTNIDTSLGLRVQEFGMGGNERFSLISSYHPSSHGNTCARVLTGTGERTKREYFKRLSEVVIEEMRRVSR